MVGDGFDNEGDISSRSPPEGDRGLVEAGPDDLLCELACPEGSAFVDLVRIFASQSTASYRYGGAVMVDHQLLTREPVVSLWASDGKFTGSIEDEFAWFKGPVESRDPIDLVVREDALDQGEQDPVLFLAL